MLCGPLVLEWRSIETFLQTAKAAKKQACSGFWDQLKEEEARNKNFDAEAAIDSHNQLYKPLKEVKQNPSSEILADYTSQLALHEYNLFFLDSSRHVGIGIEDIEEGDPIIRAFGRGPYFYALRPIDANKDIYRVIGRI